MAKRTFDAELGRCIQQARLAAGLSQQALADRVNTTQNAISQYEHGTRSIALETLVDIAAVLERPLSFFLASEEILVVRETKLGEIVADVQERPEDLTLLAELWRYVKWRQERA
ncbi:MAG: helix-turn-helix domain-containing protein [Dehalococcoidia bacterium]